MRQVIIYGYGSPSAFVHTDLGDISQEAGELRLASLRTIWPVYAERFSLHPREKVIKEKRGEVFVLNPIVFDPSENPIPAREPIRPRVRGPQHRKKVNETTS